MVFLPCSPGRGEDAAVLRTFFTDRDTGQPLRGGAFPEGDTICLVLTDGEPYDCTPSQIQFIVGSPRTDAGAPRTDAGASQTEAGAARTDAGAPAMEDGGGATNWTKSASLFIRVRLLSMSPAHEDLMTTSRSFQLKVTRL